MHLKLFAAAGTAALLLFAPARADASCCDQKMMSCCDKEVMPCCADKNAVEILMAVAPLQDDPQLNPAPPVRQATDIWFMRPTLVGRSILQGHYVIEHDNDRMARGEPCTHIYAFDDRTKPVVAFHCTHLERERASKNIAVVATRDDWQELKEFQFGGETAAHGVPSVR
jgi:hypothetical protein